MSLFKLRKYFLIASALLLCFSASALSRADNHTDLDKLVDFKALSKEYGEPKVQINLEQGLINLVAVLAAQQDPEAAAILQGLRAVSVNVYDVGDKADSALASIKKVSDRLKKQNWMPAVTVNEGDEQVRILVKQKDGLVQGLLVLAAGKDSEAVFVSIDGNLDPSKIAKLSNTLDLGVDLGAATGAKK